jgi:tetratricopeptide (TPR) repeat protein
MGKPQYHPFPYPDKSYDYAGAKLKKAWARLHKGDGEPFPDVELLTARGANAAFGKSVKGFKGDYAALAEQLQDGWRAFHAGDFGAAVAIGEAAGLFGSTLANKAQGIYAVYIEDDEKAKQALFTAVAERAEALSKADPRDANGHYFRAFAFGRLSQILSITKALAQGLGGKVKESLEAAIKANPSHADAHIAFGLYHAEIVDKIGGMIGRLTYGASADEGVKLFNAAIKLFPESPIAHLEYGNGLLMLYGNKKEQEATKFITLATELKPADAMERCDVELAKSQFEDE